MRERVVRRPEAMGARMLVANMNASHISHMSKLKEKGDLRT